MAKRILVPIVPDAPTDYTLAAISAARIARKTGGMVRLAFLTPLPPPRVDHHDRVIADTEREMERLADHAETRSRSMAAEMEGVPVEMVIRFGRPHAELSIEVEVFGPDLIALATPRHSGLRGLLRAWQLRRAAVASRVPVVLLPLPPAGGDAFSRGATAVPALR